MAPKITDEFTYEEVQIEKEAKTQQQTALNYVLHMFLLWLNLLLIASISSQCFKLIQRNTSKALLRPLKTSCSGSS